MTPRIRKIAHPHAWEILQARIDEAIVTGQPIVERPWWFEDTQTGLTYHDLYACVGWPSEVTDTSEGQPGYLAIAAVVRGDKWAPQDAPVQLLAEQESRDVPSLLRGFLALRQAYGYGLHPETLTTLMGDCDRHAAMVAMFNERLQVAGRERGMILVAPPDDWGSSRSFDTYMRTLRSCLSEGHIRLYFGGCQVLKARLREFRKDDPAVMAVGGLIHSLLIRTTWLDASRENAFTIEEEEQQSWARQG